MASVAVVNIVTFENCVNVPSLNREFACSVNIVSRRSICCENGIGIQMVNTAAEMD